MQFNQYSKKKNIQLTFSNIQKQTFDLWPQKRLTFFVIYHNFQKQSEKRILKYKRLSEREWIRKGAQIINVAPQLIKFYILTKQQGIYKLGKTSVNQLLYKIEHKNKPVFLINISKLQANFKEPIQFTLFLTCKNSKDYKPYQNLWRKMPLIFQKSTLTGKKIYQRILKILYYSIYLKGPLRGMNSQYQSYEYYESQMIKYRPFQLFVYLNRKIQNSTLKYSYQTKRSITDEMTLQKILQKTSIDECQISAEFSNYSFKDFNFKQLNSCKSYA